MMKLKKSVYCEKSLMSIVHTAKFLQVKQQLIILLLMMINHILIIIMTITSFQSVDVAKHICSRT